MAHIKQVIVMRKDLKMRKGKMVAQGAHASMKVFIDMIASIRYDPYHIVCEFSLPRGKIGEDVFSWVKEKFTKIVCSVNSEEELLAIYNKAEEGKLPCALIQDNGKTEFNGVPTYTCCAIGPADSELIDPITQDLFLL